MISEKEKINRREGCKKALYQKYKRGINTTDGVDTTLINAGVIMDRVGIAIPIMLPHVIRGVEIVKFSTCPRTSKWL